MTVSKENRADTHSGTGVPPVKADRISRRHLPHWQRQGAVYFLTWRCASSISLSEEERDIVLSALRHWDLSRWHLFAAVVMPDHVHAIARPLAKGGGVWDLAELVHSVKSYSAHEIMRRRRDRRDAGPTKSVSVVWQDLRYDRWLRDEDEFAEKWSPIIRLRMAWPQLLANIDGFIL